MPIFIPSTTIVSPLTLLFPHSAQKSATLRETARRRAAMAEATEATKEAMVVDLVGARTTNLAFRVAELGTTRVIALRVRSVIRAEMLAI